MRKGVSLILAALLCGQVVASPAFAQLRPESQTGTLRQARPESVDEKEAGEVKKEFARCVFYASKAKAGALLANSTIESVDLQAAGIRDFNKDLHMDTCLGSAMSSNQLGLAMRFNSQALRDLMAEEFYLARYRQAPTPSAPLPPASINPATSRWAQGMMSFSDCTIRNDLAASDALLRTMPNSTQERQAAGRLAPALGRCLVQGQQISFKPATIRALVAYAMWSRFVAPANNPIGTN